MGFLGLLTWSAPAEAAPAAFDPTSTTCFRVKLRRAPAWFCSFLARNSREQRRLRCELVTIRSGWRVLASPRWGGWTPEERRELAAMLRSGSAVSPYIVLALLPGTLLLLPLLAWYLDGKRRHRGR